MSSEERKKILQMVEEGRISADEAASLMRALEEDDAGTEENVYDADSGSGVGGSGESAAEFESVKARARRFATIPLWAGVVVAVLSAWGLFTIQQTAGVNFWSFCLLFPFMLGVLLIALGSAGQSSKWLYVNVDRTYQDEWPRNITIGLPLPLQLTSWFMRNFGHNIHGVSKRQLDGIVEVLDTSSNTSQPFIVNVDDNNGDRVQVYIG